jgi:hypothetical protein
MRDFAQRLIAYEARGNKSSWPNGRAAFGGVVEKLRGSLVTLSGAAGFRALLSRALVLANPEVRWLRAVNIKADGSLECPAEMAQLDKEEVAKAEVALVAQLLGLLVTFIGESLTLRLVQDAWPGAPIKDFDSITTGASKKEK